MLPTIYLGRREGLWANVTGVHLTVDPFDDVVHKSGGGHLCVKSTINLHHDFWIEIQAYAYQFDIHNKNDTESHYWKNDLVFAGTYQQHFLNMSLKFLLFVRPRCQNSDQKLWHCSSILPIWPTLSCQQEWHCACVPGDSTSRHLCLSKWRLDQYDTDYRTQNARH